MFEKYAPDAPANRVRITRNFVLSHPAHWIATFFGVGALRPAPGTWGTLAGVLVYGLLDPLMTREGWVALTAALFMLGAWACERSGRDIGVVDHGGFVIDEVVAVWAVCIMLPAGWGWWLAAFLAFRLFDIVKIWPGSWFDRRMKSGLGVMLDDIAAAVYAWALIVLLSAAWQRWA